MEGCFLAGVDLSEKSCAIFMRGIMNIFDIVSRMEGLRDGIEGDGQSDQAAS